MKLFHPIVMFLNIVLAIVTVLGYGAYYIHPERLGILPFIGLVFPVILLFHGIFLAYWGVFKPKKMLISLLILALGIPHLKSYLGNPFRDKIEETTENDYLKLMTFNIRNFSFKEKPEVVLQKVQDLFQKKESIDILCLQEHQKLADKFMQEHSFFAHKAWSSNTGTAIYSKYPILNSGTLNIGKTGNSIAWADISVDSVDIRCICAHLESNKVSNRTKELTQSESSEELLETSKYFYHRYNKSVAKRIDQSQIMLDKASEFKGPVILMGDFNDAPLSYTYKLVKNQYLDSFNEAGLGILSTYKASIPGLRIDYIFHSDHFSTKKYEVVKIGISDHYPVISHLNIKDE